MKGMGPITKAITLATLYQCELYVLPTHTEGPKNVVTFLVLLPLNRATITFFFSHYMFYKIFFQQQSHRIYFCYIIVNGYFTWHCTVRTPPMKLPDNAPMKNAIQRFGI